jgi:hypothetical protein
MTRPESVRRQMKGPYAGLLILKKKRVSRSSKYAVNIMLYEVHGVYPIPCVWDPRLPSALEMKKLGDRLQWKLASSYKAVWLNSGFLSGDVV